jgi:hypothetical protein
MAKKDDAKMMARAEASAHDFFRRIMFTSFSACKMAS